MKQIRIFVMSCLILLMTGCGIEPALSGKAFDDYQKSIQPYIAYWKKAGMTDESRLEDWLVCGGNGNGTFSWKVMEQFPGEGDEQSSRRQRDEFQRCMISSGYRYTGDCSSKYMQSRPLCGSP
jgi:hypothetical protein